MSIKTKLKINLYSFAAFAAFLIHTELTMRGSDELQAVIEYFTVLGPMPM